MAVAVAGLWRPRAGLLVLAATLPLFGSAPGGPYLAALDVAALTAVATTWRARPSGRSALTWPIAAWIVVSVASLVPLAYQPPSWQPSVLLDLIASIPEVPSSTVLHTWRALLNLLLGFGLYRAVRRSFDGEGLHSLGVAVAVGLAAALVFGLLEHAGWFDLGSYRAIGGALYETRLHSFFFHSGWLAEYIVMATPFAVAAVLSTEGRGRALGHALLVLALPALLFTEQRGAWFAAVAEAALAVTLFGARPIRDPRALRISAVVAIGAVVLGAVLILSRPEIASPVLRRLGESTANLSGRTHLWSVSTRLVSERPLLGWGLGAFAPAYDLVHPRGSPAAWPYRDTAHSLYFHLAAERGLLALSALAVVGCAAGLGLWDGARSGTHRERVLAHGLLIGGAGLAVHGVVQHMFYLKNVEWMFWILLAATSLLSGARRLSLDRIAQILVGAALVLLPYRALRLEPLEGPGNRSFGLHEKETSPSGSFRWTTGRAAAWVPWQDEVLVLELGNGHPRPAEHRIEVTVRVDGHERLNAELAGGWEAYRIPLGPPRSAGVVVEWEVHPTFRPFLAIAGSADTRSLGVVLREIRWEPGRN